MVPKHPMHITAGQIRINRMQSKISMCLQYMLTRQHCISELRSHQEGVPNIQHTNTPLTINQDVWAPGQQLARDTTAIPKT